MKTKSYSTVFNLVSAHVTYAGHNLMLLSRLGKYAYESAYKCN